MIAFELGDRFREAAEELGEKRTLGGEEALEMKVEQALLEIEHLVSGNTQVEFEIDGDTVTHHPSDDLESFLAEQASASGIDESTLLKLHVDLFARVFLEEADEEPSGMPPR